MQHVISSSRSSFGCAGSAALRDQPRCSGLLSLLLLRLPAVSPFRSKVRNDPKQGHRSDTKPRQKDHSPSGADRVVQQLNDGSSDRSEQTSHQIQLGVSAESRSTCQARCLPMLIRHRPVLVGCPGHTVVLSGQCPAWKFTKLARTNVDHARSEPDEEAHCDRGC